MYPALTLAKLNGIRFIKNAEMEGWVNQDGLPVRIHPSK